MVAVAPARYWLELATALLRQAFWLQLYHRWPTNKLELVAVLGIDWRYVCLQLRGHMVIHRVVTTVDPVPRRKVGPGCAVLHL